MNNPLTSSLSLQASALASARAPAAVDRAGATQERQRPAATGQNPPPAADVAGGRSISTDELTQAVSDINSYVQTVRRELQFSIDDTLGRTIITVLDGETQEVVRQIPAEEVLALARYLRKLEDKPVEGLIMQVKV